MGESEFPSHQVEDGDEINAGTKASSLSFDSAEDAVESFHKSVGHPPLPVRQDSRQVVLDHLRHFDHGGK